MRFMQQGTWRDLRDIPLDSTVAILTGTFNPAHIGHLEVGYQALAFHLEAGYSPVDLFLFHPHSYSPGKQPPPLAARTRILEVLIGNKPKMGILEGAEGPEHRGVRQLFAALSSHHPLRYMRVVGSDRVDHAVAEELHIPHLVVPRAENHTLLPPQFHRLPGVTNPHLSSRHLRSGAMPFGTEYAPVHDLVRELYPNATFTHLPS